MSTSIRATATPIDHAIAGNLAGAASALLFHPLDLIRVRMMSQDGTELRRHGGFSYRGFWHAATHISSTEGPFALLRGAPLGLCASGITWGLYMLVFRTFESALLLQQQHNNQEHLPLGLPSSAVASAAASVLVSFMTCPLFLIKTRMQLEDLATAERKANRINRSLYHGLKHAVETDGVRSLWRGFSAQLVMCCTMSLYMPLYERVRRPACVYFGREKLHWNETALVTVTAKLGVTVVSHPIQLVKARLQDQRARIGDTRYVSLVDAARTVVKREGLLGFYRGISVGLTQSTCRAVFQMLCYEEILARTVAARHFIRG